MSDRGDRGSDRGSRRDDPDGRGAGRRRNTGRDDGRDTSVPKAETGWLDDLRDAKESKERLDRSGLNRSEYTEGGTNRWAKLSALNDDDDKTPPAAPTAARGTGRHGSADQPERPSRADRPDRTESRRGGESRGSEGFGVRPERTDRLVSGGTLGSSSFGSRRADRHGSDPVSGSPSSGSPIGGGLAGSAPSSGGTAGGNAPGVGRGRPPLGREPEPPKREPGGRRRAAEPGAEPLGRRPTEPVAEPLSRRATEPTTDSFGRRPGEPTTDSFGRSPAEPRTDSFSRRPAGPTTDSFGRRPAEPTTDSFGRRSAAAPMSPPIGGPVSPPPLKPPPLKPLPPPLTGPAQVMPPLGPPGQTPPILPSHMSERLAAQAHTPQEHAGPRTGLRRAGMAGVEAIRGARSEVRKQLREQQRLRMWTLIGLVIVVVGALPFYFVLRAATRDPVIAALDALSVPTWASTSTEDHITGSRWCLIDCRTRERTIHSEKSDEETAKVYEAALAEAGWQRWSFQACGIEVDEGKYSCWRRDEFTLDLWARPPACTKDPLYRRPDAGGSPAPAPSVSPGATPGFKQEECTGSDVSIKVFNAVADFRIKETGPVPSPTGGTTVTESPATRPTPTSAG